MSLVHIIFHFKSLPPPHNPEARQHFLTQTEICFHCSCQSKYKSWSRLIVSFSQLLNPCNNSYTLLFQRRRNLPPSSICCSQCLQVHKDCCLPQLLLNY